MPTTEDPWEASDTGGRHRLRAVSTPTFGVDVHPTFQAGLVIEALPAAGIDFIAAKVSQGRAVYDSQDWLRRAKAAGLLAMGYCYMQPGDEDGQAQVFAQQLKAAGVPGMLDAEAIDSTGRPLLTIPSIKLMIDRTRFYGGDIRLLYVPRWWWTRLGSPNLSSLNLPLWASSYPSTAAGSPTDLYSQVTPDRWTAYGGLPVAILQFAETGSVAGTAPIDLDAFLGTRDQLATLLGIHTDPPPTETIRMRQLHLTNTGADLTDLSGVLTIDPVGISDVMPAGSHAWIQWSGACVRNTTAKAHVWWMVERHADGTWKAIDPFDVAHGQSAAFELSQGTVAVEIGLERVPPGFTFAAHLDGIGHA